MLPPAPMPPAAPPPSRMPCADARPTLARSAAVVSRNFLFNIFIGISSNVSGLSAQCVQLQADGALRHAEPSCAMPNRKVSHHSIGEGENIIARPRTSLCTRSNAGQPGCP
jgi:hypothetical protein